MDERQRLMGDEQDALAWDAAALDPLFQLEVSDIEALPASVHQSFVATLEHCAQGITGLSDIHDVRVRKSGRGYVLVAHCRMAPSATVESVHRSVDDLERLVRERKPDIARIVIHAEPASLG